MWLSKVFDWFGEDFGEDRTALLRFVSKRIDAGDSAWLGAHHREVEVDYFHYNWRLNDLRVTGEMRAPAAPRAR